MRRALRRGPLRVAAAGALLTLAALIFGAAPLLVPGVAFITLAALAPVWVRLALAGAEVSRRLETTSVVEGDVLEAVAEVRRGRLRLPGTRLLDPLAGGPVSIAPAEAGSTAKIQLVARLHRRGLQRIAAPSLLAADPFGLTSAELRGSEGPHDVLVLPRTETVRWPLDRRARRGEGEGHSRGVPLEATDIDGLRPYREGTPASRIHWPAMARGAGLMERRLVAERDQRPLVALDPRGGTSAELDLAVRAAASLTLALARNGGCRLLMAGERRALSIGADLLAWPAAHARLALVPADAAGAPRIAPGTQALSLFLIGVRDRDTMSLPLGGVGQATLVLPAEVAAPGRRPTGLTVSGCIGYRLAPAPRSAPLAATGAVAR